MKKTFTLFAVLLAGVTAQAQLWPVTPVLLKDIAPGTTRGAQALSPFAVGGKLVLRASANNSSGFLWTSDGTAAGTLAVPVTPGRTGYLEPRFFMQWNGMPYHVANYSGASLYRTGFPTSDSLGKIYDNPISITPAFSVDSMGGNLYFLYVDQFNGGVHQTNGAAGSNTRLASPPAHLIPVSMDTRLAAANGKVFYPALVAGSGTELVATDVAANTFATVKDINPGGAGSDPVLLGHMGNKVFFTAITAAAGRELWVSDGTAAGTVLLADANPGTADGDPGAFTVWNGNVYFRAKVNAIQNSTLWRSDGTPAGTTEVWGRTGGTLVGTVSGEFVNMGAFLLFQGNDTAGGEPWRTDGTNAGTYRIKDVFPHRNGVNAGSAAGGGYLPGNVIDGRFYFSAAGDTLNINDSEPWVTDGTDTGTHMVANLRPGAARSMTSDAFEFVKYDGRIYFIGNNGQTGFEVYSFPAPPPAAATPPQGVAHVPGSGSELTVFPNPCDGAATVRGATAASLAVYTSTGRFVTAVSLNVANGYTAQLTNIAAGTYLIHNSGARTQPCILVVH